MKLQKSDVIKLMIGLGGTEKHPSILTKVKEDPSYWLSRVLDDIVGPHDKYQKAVRGLYKAYAKLGEDGYPIIKNGLVQFASSELEEKFEDALKALQSETVEILSTIEHFEREKIMDPKYLVDKNNPLNGQDEYYLLPLFKKQDEIDTGSKTFEV